MACGVHAVLFRKEQTSTLSQKVERVSRVGKSVAKNIYWDGIWGVEAMFFFFKNCITARYIRVSTVGYMCFLLDNEESEKEFSQRTQQRNSTVS